MEGLLDISFCVCVVGSLAFATRNYRDPKKYQADDAVKIASPVSFVAKEVCKLAAVMIPVAYFIHWYAQGTEHFLGIEITGWSSREVFIHLSMAVCNSIIFYIYCRSRFDSTGIEHEFYVWVMVCWFALFALPKLYVHLPLGLAMKMVMIQVRREMWVVVAGSVVARGTERARRVRFAKSAPAPGPNGAACVDRATAPLAAMAALSCVGPHLTLAPPPSSKCRFVRSTRAPGNPCRPTDRRCPGLSSIA